MKKSICIILICIHYSSFLLAQNDPPKNIKDSLLMHFTWEEIKAMSPRETTNAIRVIRGQKPLTVKVSQELKMYDFFGVKLIKEIPKESARKVINERIALIRKEKNNYRQEIFPNSIVDVTEGYGYHFYDSYIDRTFSEEGYLFAVEEIKNEEISIFSNFSRRVYYYDKMGSLRLITREMGYNVNEGKQFGWADKIPYKYKYEETYVWDDSLIYNYVIHGNQRGVDSESSYVKQIDLDTVKVDGEATLVYYFKNNSFDYAKKVGSFDKSNWKDQLEKLAYIEQESSANGGVILFRNLILEYEEYKSGKTDYLAPSYTSFLQPFVIDLKEE